MDATTPAVTDLTNFGSLRINDAPAGDTATVVVVGLPRSGTSMVANVLKTLGIFMGDKVDNAVFEDHDIAAALDSADMLRFRTIADARNRAHPVWGFKRPEAYRQLNKISGLLRNPRVIVPFRDILAIALRNNISMQMDALASLPQLTAQYQVLINLIRDSSIPCLLLSYEKALQFPLETSLTIASFCGVKPSPIAAGNAAAIIENGNSVYLQASRLRYTGFVGRLVNGELHGWAKIQDRDQPRVTVELEIDGQIVQTALADLYRPDVEKAGFGDGRYGFVFPIGDGIGANSVVRIKVRHSQYALKNSGLTLENYRR